jgi:hypothetical protein
MKKPYYVEIVFSAVVMAESQEEAQSFARRNADEIISDCEADLESAVEVKSMAHLKQLDASWDASFEPYNEDGDRTLGEILPEE